MAMYVPSFSRGATSRMEFIMSGMRMPAPRACSRRKTSRRPKFGARAASTVETSSTTVAKKNVGRILKRRNVKLATVTMSVETTMYPLTSHCEVTASTWSSAMRLTSAMLMMFSL